MPASASVTEEATPAAVVEARQFSSSLYVSGAFLAALFFFFFTGAKGVCELVNMCVGPLRGRLGLRHPSVSPGMNHW